MSERTGARKVESIRSLSSFEDLLDPLVLPKNYDVTYLTGRRLLDDFPDPIDYSYARIHGLSEIYPGRFSSEHGMKELFTQEYIKSLADMLAKIAESPRLGLTGPLNIVAIGSEAGRLAGFLNEHCESQGEDVIDIVVGGRKLNGNEHLPIDYRPATSHNPEIVMVAWPDKPMSVAQLSEVFPQTDQFIFIGDPEQTLRGSDQPDEPESDQAFVVVEMPGLSKWQLCYMDGMYPTQNSYYPGKRYSKTMVALRNIPIKAEG